MPVRRDPKTGVWKVTISVGGRRFRKQLDGNHTKAQALEVEADARRRLLNHAKHAPERSISEAVARWLEHEAVHLKSYANLREKARMLLPYIKKRPLRSIHEAAEAAKGAWVQQGLAPATINRRLAILRRVANLAHREWGWLDKPVIVRLMPGERARHFYLTFAQVEALAQACRQAGDVVRLAAYTGLRRGELLQLTADNFREGCLILDARTKNGRPRLVPVPEQVSDIAGRLPLKLTVHQVRLDFELAREAVGLPHVHFHDLRHTYASWLVQSGASLTAVRDLLGHSSLAVTSRYAHLSPEHLRKAVNGIGK